MWIRVIQVEIPVGFIAPKFTASGTVNAAGTHYIAAIIMALREINNKSDGIADKLLLKYNLKMASRFPRQNFLEAINAGYDLAENVFNKSGVIAVVGTSATASSIATAKVFANTFRHIPQVGYGANDSSLGHKDSYPYFLRTISADAHDGKIIADISRFYFGWSTVTVFSSEDTYGNDAFLEFQEEASVLGINIESKFSFLSGIQDFTELIKSAIMKGGVLKVFVLLMKSVDAGRLIEQGYKLGLFQKGCQILGTEYVMMPATWQAMSAEADVATLMNGVIGVSSFASRNSSQYLDFVARWKQQPSTQWISTSGSVKCSGSRDDDGGEWLYQGYPTGDVSTSKLTCCGVDFKTFAADGSDIDDAALFAYDAVYALAYGLELLHFDGNMTANRGAELYNLLVSNVSFEGVTGRVNFGSGILGAEAYGRGDRETGIAYNVLNFNPSLYHSNVNAGAGALSVVGTWDSDLKQFTPCSTATNTLCTEWHFNTVDNSVPFDVAPVLEVQMKASVRAGLQSGAALCVILTLFFWAVVFFCEGHSLVKLAQPKMLYIVLLGALCAGVRVFVATMDITDTTCVIGKWLGHVSFALVFGALLIKTWRLGKVMNSGMRRVKVTVTDIQRMFAIGFFVFCLILLVDTFMGKPRRAYDSYFDGHHDVHLIKCKNENPSTTTVLFVIEGCLMAVAARLCWSTKDVPSAVNDSKYIAMCKYDCSLGPDVQFSDCSLSYHNLYRLFNLIVCLLVCSSWCSNLSVALRLRCNVPRGVSLDQSNASEFDYYHVFGIYSIRSWGTCIHVRSSHGKHILLCRGGGYTGRGGPIIPLPW